MRRDRKDKIMLTESSRYRTIGEEIKQKLFPELEDIKIAWLTSDKEKRAKGKTIFAECKKVASTYEWCCPYDFMIVVYEPNVSYFTREQIRELLEHELMHAGSDGKIVPHDVEEFSKIIQKYGVNWAQIGAEFDLFGE